MTEGLRCWDAAGNVRLDTTTRLSRVVAERHVNKDDSGSLTINGIPNFGQVRVFALQRRPGTGQIAYVPHQLGVSVVDHGDTQSVTISYTPVTVAENVPSLRVDSIIVVALDG